jgi:DNA-binding NtrC family response regulator
MVGTKKNTIKILLLDDDDLLRHACESILVDSGFHVLSGRHPDDGLLLARDHQFDIAIVDYDMPGMNGLEFMRRFAKNSPLTDFIMITGKATIEMAIEATRLGAFDYLQKPFHSETLLTSVQRLVEKRKNIGKSSSSELCFEFEGETVRVIGKSQNMQDVFRIIEKVAPTESTVLISGESGTGKEIIAKAIHALSSRARETFFAMDCGALVETLFESELFGHVKGSFTGATATKHGALEIAQGGTFFFDEIGNISMSTQGKVLRAIQEREIRRVGGSETIKIDVRIIAATNLDLEKAIRDNKFRDDLYYRLSVIPVQLPPLRDRKEDIPLLLDTFLQQYNLRRKNKPIRNVQESALNAMLAYEWPGNVRELQNIIERALVIEDTTLLTLTSLPQHIQSHANQEREPGNMISLSEAEKKHIHNILHNTNWNISQSARILGIDRKTLYDKIKKYNLKQ